MSPVLCGCGQNGFNQQSWQHKQTAPHLSLHVDPDVAKEMGVQKHVTEFRIFKMGKKILLEFKEKSVKKIL